MNKLYLGIDPGKKGGWALVDDTGFVVDAAALNLDDLMPFANAVGRTDLIGLERAQPAKDQGHQFEYGRGFGRLEGVIAMHRPLTGVLYMAPAFWKARMGVSADKKLTVARALVLMPELGKWKNRLGNLPDGIAEAALIARSITDTTTVAAVEKNAAARARAAQRGRVSYRD